MEQSYNVNNPMWLFIILYNIYRIVILQTPPPAPNPSRPRNSQHGARDRAAPRRATLRLPRGGARSDADRVQGTLDRRVPWSTWAMKKI